MVSVDRPDRVVEAIVVLDEAGVFGFGGFIERVVTGDPIIVFVVSGKLFPQPDDSVLVVLVVPEICDVSSVVGVPVCVLATGGSVQIKNGVNAVFGAEVYHPIEVLESLSLENSRVLVIWGRSEWLDHRDVGVISTFEMAVVKWEANAVEP